MASNQEADRVREISGEVLSDRRILYFCIGFTAVSVALIYWDFHYAFLLPVIFFGAVLFFLKPDLIWYGIAILTPLSINPNDVELGSLSLSLPAEPLLFLLVVLLIYYLFSQKDIDTSIFTHPFSILIYLYLVWMLITSMTSVNQLVSVKYLIAKCWFIFPCYFFSYFFLKKEDRIRIFLNLFTVGMSIVAFYNIIHLSTHHFEDKPSQWTMQPFFKDHAILGAVLAMTIPVSFALVKLNSKNILIRNFFIFLILVLIFCLIITYSRAAWVSIIPALFLYIIFKLKVKFRYLLFVFLLIIFYLTYNVESIIKDLEQNKVSSSDDLVENFESITNISSDPSNLERINRWSCALAMWQAKPIFGWGPGTYMFEYAPFQLAHNYTIISTNFGDVGNAHSEYLGPLAESGVLGFVLFLLIFIMTFYYAFRVYYKAYNGNDKIYISTAACALMTYFVHGILNNYLDTDKASVIFWFLISVLIYFDIKYKRLNA
ncbi:MAG: O-antigen ligase family protein [Saprospiraceae bacterium]|nr:O-antigen ligase family protein [Candidatus Vicinibacter affinis]